MAWLHQQAEWLERTHPQAAASLREGPEEALTINRLGLSRTLRRCLATTNVIESLLSGVARRTGRVTRWHSGEMALWWAGAAALETGKRLRKTVGHQDLGMLKAALDEDHSVTEEARNLVDKGRLVA